MVVHFAAGSGQAVVESELVQHHLQILDVHFRRVIFAATKAMRARPDLACSLVKRDAERAGPLEHVKQLAERNVEEQEIGRASCRERVEDAEVAGAAKG